MSVRGFLTWSSERMGYRSNLIRFHLLPYPGLTLSTTQPVYPRPLLLPFYQETKSVLMDVLNPTYQPTSLASRQLSNIMT